MISLITGDPLIAERITREFIDSGVIALIGAYQSTVCFLASEIAEKNHIPFLISTALADNLTQRNFKYTFRIESSLSKFVADQYRFLEDNRVFDIQEKPTIALVFEKTMWGSMAAQFQRDYAKAKKYKIILEVPYLHSLSDLNFIAQKIEKEKPSIVLQSSYLEDSILIARALSKISWKPTAIVATGAGPKDSNFINTLGDISNGWFVINEWAADMKRANVGNINKQFHQMFGQDLDGISAVSYVTTWTIKEALENAKSLNGEDLQEAIAGLKLHKGPATILPLGRVSFDSHNNNVANNLVTQIRDGAHHTVWPVELAAARPVFNAYFQKTVK